MRRALLAVAAALLLAGCGGSGDEELVVFAASSLSDVAPAIDPDATVVTGGSNDLAAQIRDGADPGVFLSASGRPVQELREAGLIAESTSFATNRLVIVVPRANPSGATELSDLDRSGMKLVLGAEGVPVGDYARAALAAAGLEEALAQVVSYEDDVKGVLTKVALGEADAGIVYATDVKAARNEVRAFPVARRYQPEIRYYAALVEPVSDPARAYLHKLLGREGEEALRRAGFRPLPT